ncbi:MAG TPA: rod shape-determining protein MreC [Candidatus Choladousia intestinavium]|uniref:Cell shape-determining protein MreC n=1 Tax=Candidatus Choladousia intestinavium TaxID=2840727 RepID=A0A9D1AC82_9FIRM|nr:rod shape-determining protein MreC [Candidatus Choladousia intestinavium]
MKKKTNENLRNKYLLIALSILCAVLIAVSFFESSLVSPVKEITGFFITPVQKGISGFGSWLSGLTDNFQDAASLREENASLQERVDTLTEENSQLIQDREELDRLRELYNLDQQYDEYEKVGARIIAKESGNWFNLFTIDKGSSDGIEVDMNVISGGGLVGIVTDVGSSWATVRSIIDDNSNVSAMVSTTSDQCIVAGDLRLMDEGSLNLLSLTDSENNVHVGDSVVTSYISEKFLPGILIGYIDELNNDANNLTKSGYITPVVDFRHLQEVLVILETKEYAAPSQEGDSTQAVTGGETESGTPQSESSSETETQQTQQAQ